MGEEAIVANKLTKKFGSFTAVDEINLSINKGEVFGFLGANGAGKSTAIKMLCGLLSPSSGQATVAGYDIYKDRNKIKSNIGYMSQRFSLYNDLSLKENIRFYGGIYGLSRTEIKRQTDILLKKLGLEDKRNLKVSSLPLGWKQKLAFSIAMVHQPKIVFLDEPTGGVDPITRRHFWDLIYEAAYLGTTVFVTTHYMDEAEYCDRLSIMVDGKIEAIGSPQELRSEFTLSSIDLIFRQLAKKSKRVV